MFILFPALKWHTNLLAIVTFAVGSPAIGQPKPRDHSDDRNRVVHVSFDNGVEDEHENLHLESSHNANLIRGLEGKAIRIGAVSSDNSNSDSASPQHLVGKMTTRVFQPNKDFSLRFWVRTIASRDQRMVLLSNKDYQNNGLVAQKQKGWMFGCFNGTWAWNMGSGKRRISYDRTNGQFMPINDGRWHQLAMTHSVKEGLVRLYLDGVNWVTYNVRDSGDFDFGVDGPLTIGWSGNANPQMTSDLPAIAEGAKKLQRLVDEFNRLGLPPVTQNELKLLVSRPAKLLSAKIQQLKEQGSAADAKQLERLASVDMKPMESLSRQLMSSPYTVHQSSDYNEVAHVFKLYRLEEGKIVIDEKVAERLAKLVTLSVPSFDLDELMIWDRVVSHDEMRRDYAKHFAPKTREVSEDVKSLVAGCWNIHHGGLHESIEEDGWDSRQVIVDLLKRENIDVIMMQETYSAGDYIAAELGFYYATTIDWDNMHQGANISVISRFPITKVYVPPKSTFMNVAAKVSLSQTQDIFVMSNWYGMRNFEDVFRFHKSRFAKSNDIPILFGGDFNAVPDGDGGDSLASRMLLAEGFVDAYRYQFPDAKKSPAPTHESNRRIDQLYFKGKGLENTSTEVLSEWPSRFPADHFLIKSVFELDYSKTDKKR